MAASTATLEPIAQPAHPSLRHQVSRVPYLPGLDGMRALAVIAVMVYHANHGWLSGGFLGVEVFFVISGYLITLLLIAEHERTGGIDLGQFWLRRARRLLPALFVTARRPGGVHGAVRARPLGANPWRLRRRPVLRQQLVPDLGRAGYTDVGAFAPLRHLWSLAVEEQFYLVWPIVMVLLLRRGRRRLPRVAVWLFAHRVADRRRRAVLSVPGDVDSECAPRRSERRTGTIVRPLLQRQRRRCTCARSPAPAAPARRRASPCCGARWR